MLESPDRNGSGTLRKVGAQPFAMRLRDEISRLAHILRHPLLTSRVARAPTNIFTRTLEMLDQHPEVEKYVRDTAYQLWASAGCPEGLSEKFWSLARDISTEVESLLDIKYSSEPVSNMAFAVES